MLNCLLWGTGEVFRDNVNLVKYHEQNNQFHIVGITSTTRIYSEFEGYRYIPKENIMQMYFDFVVVMARGSVFKDIFYEAVNMGISKEKIYSYKVFSYSVFDIERYSRLRKDTPTIFSNNCWGGLMYHALGLEFRSPLINGFESDDDYLKLITNPKNYMEKKLNLIEMKTEGKMQYPVCGCEDICLHFNHVTSFAEADMSWETRKKRVNWDNLFVEMFTENAEIAKEFSKLPYKKKICFVPFQTDEPSLIYLEFRDMEGMREIPLWKIVNGMATGAYPYYDPFVLLETGEIKKICNFRRTG